MGVCDIRFFKERKRSFDDWLFTSILSIKDSSYNHSNTIYDNGITEHVWINSISKVTVWTMGDDILGSINIKTTLRR